MSYCQESMYALQPGVSNVNRAVLLINSEYTDWTPPIRPEKRWVNWDLKPQKTLCLLSWTWELPVTSVLLPCGCLLKSRYWLLSHWNWALKFFLAHGISQSAAICFFARSKSSGYSSLWLCRSLNRIWDAVFGQLSFRGLLEVSYCSQQKLNLIENMKLWQLGDILVERWTM